MSIKKISPHSLKRILVSSSLIAGLAVATVPVMAQTVTPTRPTTSRAARTEERLDQTLTRLKTRADNEITRRVSALTALIGRITNFKRISDAQKSSFSTNIQAEITALNQLKTKIDADTDITTLKSDVQSIVNSFRVYALYIPSTRIVANADIVLDIANQMQQYTQKLQDAINTTQSAGKDVSTITPLMTDRNAKITDAITQAQNAITTVSSLTPAGYPGNQTQLKSARDMLSTARKDLRTAQQDALQIRQKLKSIGGTTISKSPTPTTAH